MGITTEKLYEVIRAELHEGVESTDIVDVVLPMLEQVWEEGYEAGFDDGRGISAVWLEGDDRVNPYRTSS